MSLPRIRGHGVGRILGSIVLISAAFGMRQPSTLAAGTQGTSGETLSVYTCCGSLSGFSGRQAGELGSVRSIYGDVLSTHFPGLLWRETPFSSQDALLADLAAAVRTGTPPDLVFIQGGAVGYAVLRGLAQPLDSYFARAAVTGSTFLPGMARWAHFGGHWWAIPAVSGPMGGQHIFLPAVLTPLGYDARTLRTFEDYYRMSEKAVRFDSAGTLTRIGYWPGTDSWETIGTLMCPPGHGLYGPGDQPTATDPCNAAYLRYLARLVTLYGGYRKLQSFVAGDPDFLSGKPASYLADGKAVIPSSAIAYWNLSALDTSDFGRPGGLAYGLTTMPVTVHGTLAEAANYPSTQQELIIPRGALHPELAFAASTLMYWDNSVLLGRAAVSGSPIRKDQHRWLDQVFAGEAAARKQAGLPGNPIAALAGVQLQPTLALLSTASNPINPVDPYYQRQLAAATTLVLSGLETPEAALQGVQQRVLAEQVRLKAAYGDWRW